MKLKLKTLNLTKTPIEMTIYPRTKAVFDKNGVADVPDRIGVILLADNPAYVRVPDDYGTEVKAEVKPEPEKKEKRRAKAESIPVAPEEEKKEFLAAIK